MQKAFPFAGQDQEIESCEMYRKLQHWGKDVQNALNEPAHGVTFYNDLTFVEIGF
jgi:hypothetical protein